MPRKPSAARVVAAISPRPPAPLPKDDPFYISPEEMVKETLYGSSGKTPRLDKELTAFVRAFVRLGLDYRQKVVDRIGVIEGYYPPDRVDAKLLRAEIRKILQDSWGEDPGLDMFADVLAYGRYIH